MFVSFAGFSESTSFLIVVVTVVQEMFDRFFSFSTYTEWRSDFLDVIKVFVETAMACENLRELVVDVASLKADGIRWSLKELFGVISKSAVCPFLLPHLFCSFFNVVFKQR